jgi:hypothetical protein
MVGASARETTVVTVPIAVPVPVSVPVMVEHATAVEALRYGLERVADEYIRLRRHNRTAASTDLLRLVGNRLSADLISLGLHADLLAVAADIYGHAAREPCSRSGK